jgi:hypothetical protein
MDGALNLTKDELSKIIELATRKAVSEYRKDHKGGRPPKLSDADWSEIAKGIAEVVTSNADLSVDMAILYWFKHQNKYGKEATDAFYTVGLGTVRREYYKRKGQAATGK